MTVAKLERQVMAAMKGDGRLSWDVKLEYPDLPDDFAELSRSQRRPYEVPEEFGYTPSVDGKPLTDAPFLIQNE